MPSLQHETDLSVILFITQLLFFLILYACAYIVSFLDQRLWSFVCQRNQSTQKLSVTWLAWSVSSHSSGQGVQVSCIICQYSFLVSFRDWKSEQASLKARILYEEWLALHLILVACNYYIFGTTVCILFGMPSLYLLTLNFW